MRQITGTAACSCFLYLLLLNCHSLCQRQNFSASRLSSDFSSDCYPKRVPPVLPSFRHCCRQYTTPRQVPVYSSCLRTSMHLNLSGESPPPGFPDDLPAAGRNRKAESLPTYLQNSFPESQESHFPESLSDCYTLPGPAFPDPFQY